MLQSILETMDVLTHAKAKGKPVDVVFLDFAKAFDTVPHRRLLLKLSNYGIQGRILEWIKAFLSNRKQRVLLGDTCSDWVDVTSGVPQGSVLGPTLFIIYINDLPDNIRNPCKIYADDTKIIASSSSQQERDLLQNDINNITEWTRKWLVKLNVQKCKIMHTGKVNSGSAIYNYTMTDIDTNELLVLETTNSERDLGVQISADLKPSDQVNKAAAKANSMLGMLKRTFVTRETGIWKKLYTTYVRPHLEFANSAWQPYLKQDIQTLEKVQHRATKVPQDLKKHSYEERCRILDLNSLEERRIRGDLIQKFKLEHGIEEINWHVEPIILQARGGHRKRFHREIVRNCEQRHQFFNNRIANAWNELPDEVANARSTDDFKRCLDNYKRQKLLQPIIYQ